VQHDITQKRRRRREGKGRNLKETIRTLQGLSTKGDQRRIYCSIGGKGGVVVGVWVFQSEAVWMGLIPMGGEYPSSLLCAQREKQ